MMKVRLNCEMKRLLEKYNKLPMQVRASFWFLICAFLQKGISFITTPIFTRILSTEDYGQFNVFISWLGIVTVFVSLNLYYGVYSQGLIKFEEQRKKYSSSLQGLTLTLVAGWLLVYLLFFRFWNDLFSLSTIQMMSMLVMIWTTAVFNFWSMEQRVDFKYRKLVIVTLLVSIAKPCLGIFLVMHTRDKVTARILGIVIVEFVMYTGFFICQMYRGKMFFSKKYWKYALTFNIPLIPHYLSVSILGSSDRIMIARLIGSNEAGIYSLAYSVSQIMTMLNTALMQTIEPWIYRKIKTKQIKDIAKVAYPLFIVVAVVNLFVIALAPEIISIFAPKAYYDAIWIVPPIAMSVYFMFAYSFFAAFEFYYEKTKYISLATMTGATLNIILNYIFMQIWGYYAAGYTTLICYMLYAVFHFVFMKRICRDYLCNAKPYNTKVLTFITVFFMGASFLFLATYNFQIIRYGIIVGLIIPLFICRKYVVGFIRNMLELKKEI